MTSFFGPAGWVSLPTSSLPKTSALQPKDLLLSAQEKVTLYWIFRKAEQAQKLYPHDLKTSLIEFLVEVISKNHLLVRYDIICDIYKKMKRAPLTTVFCSEKFLKNYAKTQPVANLCIRQKVEDAFRRHYLPLKN